MAHLVPPTIGICDKLDVEVFGTLPDNLIFKTQDLPQDMVCLATHTFSSCTSYSFTEGSSFAKAAQDQDDDDMPALEDNDPENSKDSPESSWEDMRSEIEKLRAEISARDERMVQGCNSIDI